MRFHDSILIQTSPERVFSSSSTCTRTTSAGIPTIISSAGSGARAVRWGVIFSFEETIAGERQQKRVVFTRVEPSRHIEFAPTNRLVRLFLPRLFFHIEPEGDACRFSAEIYLRIGPIGARLNRREFAAVRQHMREEGENLKRLLEEDDSGGEAPATAAP